MRFWQVERQISPGVWLRTDWYASGETYIEAFKHATDRTESVWGEGNTRLGQELTETARIAYCSISWLGTD